MFNINNNININTTSECQHTLFLKSFFSCKFVCKFVIVKQNIIIINFKKNYIFTIFIVNIYLSFYFSKSHCTILILHLEVNFCYKMSLLGGFFFRTTHAN